MDLVVRLLCFFTLSTLGNIPHYKPKYMVDMPICCIYNITFIPAFMKEDDYWQLRFMNIIKCFRYISCSL